MRGKLGGIYCVEDRQRWRLRGTVAIRFVEWAIGQSNSSGLPVTTPPLGSSSGLLHHFGEVHWTCRSGRATQEGLVLDGRAMVEVPVDSDSEFGAT